MENNVLSRYQALFPSLQAVIGMRALIGPSLTQKSVLMDCMNAYPASIPGHRGWSLVTLTRALEELQRVQLLDARQLIPMELLHEITALTVDGPQGAALLQVIEKQFPFTLPDRSGWYSVFSDNGLRKLRLSIYTNDEETYRRLRAIYDKNYQHYGGIHMLFALFTAVPIRMDWLKQRTLWIGFSLFAMKLDVFQQTGEVTPGFLDMLDHFMGRQQELAQASLPTGWISDMHLLTGDGAGLEQSLALSDDADHQRLGCQGAMAFLTGDNTRALELFRDSLKRYRQQTRKRKIFLEGRPGLYFLLALLATNDPTVHGEIQTCLEAVPREGNRFLTGFQGIQALLWFVQGTEAKARALIKDLAEIRVAEPLSLACVALAVSVMDMETTQRHRPLWTERVSRWRQVLPLVAHVYACLLARLDNMPVATTPWIDFSQIIQLRQPWQRALDSLKMLLQSGKPQAPVQTAATPTKRLAWFVDPHHRVIEVLEQSFRVRQGWSDGRPVAVKRLHEQDPRLTYLTDQDRRALRALRKESGWSQDTYYFDVDQALLALIGHPTVFDATHRDRPLELVAYPLELVVNQSRQGFRITLSHTAEEPRVFLEEETPNRFRVISFTDKSLALREILGAKGLEVPKQAREQVIHLVRESGWALPVRSELADLEVEAVEGNTTPVIQLRPLEQGLRASLHVRPFGDQGPYYLPGQGGRSVLATIGKSQQRANRDLAAERQALHQVHAACPQLQQLFDGGYEGSMEGLEPCLDLLLELQACPHPLVVEWPEGKPLRVYPPVAARQMVLQIKQSRDWFQVNGELQLAPDQRVAVDHLLERLDQARGRFIPLDDGRFVALASHFRQQLERLRAMTETGRDGRKLATLGALALQDLVEESGEVQADRAWQALAARLQQARTHQPVVPSTLQAELRDYQVEGFVWLSRLAHWGAGACLADDMGLGKTVMAIAAMLEQAGHGPCLVVAPTSVCHNWEQELARFAPVLQVYRLSAAVDRTALLASLGPMTVLVASYGLLQVEEERLTAISWRVLVLDEAQAIKNAETRRAQASRKLNADFRMALSGTPIENYLDELWSLFQVINPNLLGSRESFQRRFAGPIERNRDAAALHALRALVRPFILRRTKSQVLAELPSRTDVTLEVELPEDERAFHEALRQRALASLADLAGDDPQRRFRILAEITRLRRACCHPGLVDPETTLPGAKLTLFLELTAGLIRNRHKALVFSQFVGQLERVRVALDSQGIRYQYLDGSTPAREREKRVAAFQAGEGDLFLISLKAGGLGLNLTAADYVIHLDPWWNPAVEDQASDRAHRMGQSRPVTVYRMIVRDSIEEKMLQLHQDKRDLADTLLDGTDTATRLSEEDLMGLIRG